MMAVPIRNLGVGAAGLDEIITRLTSLPADKGCGRNSFSLAWDLECHILESGDKASVEGNVATQAVGSEIRKKKWKWTDGGSCSQEMILQFDMVGIQILNETW